MDISGSSALLCASLRACVCYKPEDQTRPLTMSWLMVSGLGFRAGQLLCWLQPLLRQLFKSGYEHALDSLETFVYPSHDRPFAIISMEHGCVIPIFTV